MMAGTAAAPVLRYRAGRIVCGAALRHPDGRWDDRRRAWVAPGFPQIARSLVDAYRQSRTLGLDQSILDLAARATDATQHPDRPAHMKTPLWSHQQGARRHALDRDASMLAMDMGTGKTLTAICLANDWSCMRVLVLCPARVVGVWPNELQLHSARQWAVCALTKSAGSAQKKVQLAEQAVNLAHLRHQPIMVAVNFETAYRDAFAEFLARVEWDLVIVDESHRLKSAGGTTSLTLQRVVQAPRRLLLTGTPMPNNELDIYAQFRLMDPRIFGSSNTAFKAKYATETPAGDFICLRNEDEFRAKFRSAAYVVRREDAIDLPDTQDVPVPAVLSAKSWKAYTSMRDTLVADIGTGVVTAANGLVKLLRLQQVCSGFLKNTSTAMSDVQVIDDAKKAALTDLLTDITEPVVVFCQFQADLDAIETTARDLNRVYGELSGRRQDLTPACKMPSHVDIMGVQIQAGGVGIDLTRSRVAIYYSHGFNNGDDMQSRARVHRPGQDREVIYYHITAEGPSGQRTIDHSIQKALKNKTDIIRAVLDDCVEHQRSGV